MKHVSSLKCPSIHFGAIYVLLVKFWSHDFHVRVFLFFNHENSLLKDPSTFSFNDQTKTEPGLIVL